MIEFMEELGLASLAGFKSKHDDCIDSISMLGSLTTWKPSEEIELHQSSDGIWEIEEDTQNNARLESYIV